MPARVLLTTAAHAQEAACALLVSGKTRATMKTPGTLNANPCMVG